MRGKLTAFFSFNWPRRTPSLSHPGVTHKETSFPLQPELSCYIRPLKLIKCVQKKPPKNNMGGCLAVWRAQPRKPTHLCNRHFQLSEFGRSGRRAGSPNEAASWWLRLWHVAVPRSSLSLFFFSLSLSFTLRLIQQIVNGYYSIWTLFANILNQ